MAVSILGAVGAGGATILYFIGQKFKVYEDPRIEPVQEALPGVNCGACGFPGCNAFAAACVESDTLETNMMELQIVLLLHNCMVAILIVLLDATDWEIVKRFVPLMPYMSIP